MTPAELEMLNTLDSLPRQLPSWKLINYLAWDDLNAEVFSMICLSCYFAFDLVITELNFMLLFRCGGTSKAEEGCSRKILPRRIIKATAEYLCHSWGSMARSYAPSSCDGSTGGVQTDESSRSAVWILEASPMSDDAAEWRGNARLKEERRSNIENPRI
ncbi:hypothetical protein LR48_Vigan86s002300 [Vigna angularis]|uniref:Uncharacterized protein n=1 Tax=Phaseolus angularis TaxID=3914 RepID=A0A0L9T5C1_PHAAN|nr:hypothetical protein LR48_Vigan86s002300 [Vigna angularis]